MHRRAAKAFLFFAVLLSLPFCIADVHNIVRVYHFSYGDYQVYLTGAYMVREGHSAQVYNGAVTGETPQQRFLRPEKIFAAPSSPLEKTAEAHGMSGVRMYLYPPTLADMLVPFSYAGLDGACLLWLGVELVSLAGTAACIALVLGWRVLSWKTASLCAALFLFRPVSWGFVLGQVTALLMFFWAAGTVLYRCGHVAASAILFATAAAIKLTPAMVLVPFLLWMEWGWIAWFFGTLTAWVAMLLAANGAGTSVYFFRRVLPVMSAGYSDISNLSLSYGVQMLWVGLHHGDPWYPMAAPNSVVLLGKLLSFLALAAFFVLVWRYRRTVDRTLVLAIAALLSACTAPVSWRHGYSVAFFLLCLLWARAVREGEKSLAYLVLLTVFTLELSFVIDSALVHKAHGLLLSATPMVLPLLCLAISYWTLARAGREREYVPVPV